MAYTKTVWEDGVTPLSAQNMNKLETQYDEAKADLDAHKADYANPHQVKAEQVFALGGVPSGTAFPSAPANYTLFYRTDLKKIFIYLP